MLVKRNNCNTVWDVIQTNTGLTEDEYLNPNKKPYIKNLKEAVKLLKDIIFDNPDIKVRIIGDYDADGIDATYILFRGLITKYPELDVKWRLPHRFSEGYGLSTSIVDELNLENDVIITVDNGIAAIDAIKKAKDNNNTVIVIDHHLPMTYEGKIVLPNADIIVDPEAEEESEYAYYCGAGLAYRFVCELLEVEEIPELLVNATIGTVADVMPITKTNWALVKSGLKYLEERNCNKNLAKLCDDAKITGPLQADDIGFKLGPIFNASGRLYDNGAERVLETLLSPETDGLVPFKIKGLIDTNTQRKQTERNIMEKVEITERPIVLYIPNISEGLVGIIAGRLCEKYYCPTIVFTNNDEKGILKGSGRSIPEIHLKDTLDKIQSKMLGYGGHAQAAGLAILPSNFEIFKSAFKMACGEIPDKDTNSYYDLYITEDDVPKMVEDLKKYAPFGEGNPMPVFRMTCNLDGEYRRIGEDKSHFMVKTKGKMKIDPVNKTIKKTEDITYFGFGMANDYEKNGCPKSVDAIVRVRENIFNGKKSYNVEIVDAVS